MENEIKIIDEMQPLKDFLLGKSSTDKFINDCREIRKTEDADFEIIDAKFTKGHLTLTLSLIEIIQPKIKKE